MQCIARLSEKTREREVLRQRENRKTATEGKKEAIRRKRERERESDFSCFLFCR